MCGLVCAIESTQAVVVEPTLLWQIAWAAQRAGWSANQIVHLVTHVNNLIQSNNSTEIRRTLDGEQIHYPFEGDPRYEFQWYPERLKSLLRTTYPITIFIHICRYDLGDVQFNRERQLIEQICQRFRQDFRIVIEERPRVELVTIPGGAIGGASLGTLGGFLSDAKGIVYGTTCSHVAPLGSHVNDSKGIRLGSVTYATVLKPSANGQLCNQYHPSLNEVDAALFTATQITHSGCSQASTQYGSGQNALMTGGQSRGPNIYPIGGITLILKLHHAGQAYCFKDLFTLKTNLSGPLPVIIQLATATCPVQGDSGAWVHATTSAASDWIGMLVGSDQIEGFATDATAVLTWASAARGTSLSVW